MMTKLRALTGLASADGLKYLRSAIGAYARRPAADCPCCGYHGPFESAGAQFRMNARCPRCESLERHRLLALALDRGFLSFAGREVLHFAPELSISRLVDAQGPKRRVTADIEPGRAELTLDIEALALPDQSFDHIICSHVLEHVDDRRANAEMFRVLKPGGEVMIMLPLIEGWTKSYEDPAIRDPREREMHFGQDDHVRYFGADVRRRITEAGFTLSEFTAEGRDSVRYNLLRGEKIFLATRPT